MLHAKFQDHLSSGSEEEDLKGVYHMCGAAILVL